MGRFPSGQRGQTVNLLQLASMVRIHHLAQHIRNPDHANVVRVSCFSRSPSRGSAEGSPSGVIRAPGQGKGEGEDRGSAAGAWRWGPGLGLCGRGTGLGRRGLGRRGFMSAKRLT